MGIVRIPLENMSMLNFNTFAQSPKLDFCQRRKSNNTSRTHYLPLCRSSPKNTTPPTQLLNKEEDIPFPEELRRELMPQHVAVIMDGNRRWADRQGLSPKRGHQAGCKSLSEITRLCADIKVATFYLFSTENWNRSKEEVDSIMWLTERFLVEHLEIYNRQGIKISTIGDVSKLPKSLQQVIENSQEETKDNTKMHVIHAINYSGKQDLVQACQSIATQAKNGLVEVKDINDSLLEQQLQTNLITSSCLSSPDLLIRTSGELRISNFLLWQLTYSELYFTDTLWPDFRQAEFAKALQSFQMRARRFGGR